MRSRDKLQTGAQGTQTEEHKPPLSGEQKPKTKVQRAKRRNVQKAKLNARQEGKSFSLPLMLRRNP
jgi:hypothetical protein